MKAKISAVISFVLSLSVLFAACGQKGEALPDKMAAYRLEQAAAGVSSAGLPEETKGTAEENCVLCTSKKELQGEFWLVLVNQGKIIPIEWKADEKKDRTADWQTMQYLVNGKGNTGGCLTVNHTGHSAELHLTMRGNSLLDAGQAARHFCGACLQRLFQRMESGFEAVIYAPEQDCFFPLTQPLSYTDLYLLHTVRRENTEDGTMEYYVYFLPRSQFGKTR